jgi:DNA-binding transcriptional regulator YhcF (GntR family)
MNRPNDERGRAVRAQLAGLVRECADAGRPLPRCREIAVMLGLSASQISRHLNRMMDEGVFTPTCRHTRIYPVIERIAA